MLALAPTSALHDSEHHLQLNELGDVEHALKPTTELLCQAAHNDSVQLFCTVPTWAPASDTCIDLHDLHDLRSRSLLFIHDLVNSLRASGIPTSYTLAPSNSPLCLVCASHSQLDKRKVQMSAFEAYERVKPSSRDRVLLIELQEGPTLVIT